MQVRWVSALLGRMKQTIFGYVTFLVLNSTSSFGMKYIVLVPSILLLTLWDKRQMFLAKYLAHISFSGTLMRWWNSCSTPVIRFRTEFASKLLIYFAALSYRALLTDGCCCSGLWNGYWWVLGALLGVIFGLRGSTFGASCWHFLFSTLGDVGVSGGIICTLLSDWFGRCVVKQSRDGVAMIGGILTLGNFGATLGGETGGLFEESVGTWCYGWTVACWKFSASWSNACIWAYTVCAYGAASAELQRAWISSVAAMVAFSAEDRNGILELCGTNSTVLGCINALVSGMYMVEQR